MPFGVIFLYIRMGEGGEEKREGAPELGFGFPQKLIRTSESPFRMAAAAVSPGAPLFTPNGTAGPFLLYSDGAAVFDAREPEPLAASAVARAFHPSPLAAGAFRSAAAVLRYPQFTPAQWQELQRQALIYKYLASSVPVPADLLFESGALALPALPLFSAAGGGGAGGYYGVRFPGADSADPEPGRCRRTDGKKWRCARDAAPEQKYCERHMHRGRPRSRKPVEPAPKTAGSASTGVSPAGNGAPLPRPGVKLPFLSMAPEKDTRYMDWVDGRIEAMQPNSSGGGGFPCSYQGGRHNHAGSSCSDPNDPISYSFLVPELDNTRRFIDAWSTESLSVPPADPEPALREKTCSTNLLPGSALTLSMSGSGEDHEGAGGVQMGVSAPGGPLGEVLRPSNVVSPSGGSGGACSCGGGSLASLVGKGGSGSGSPRESPPRMLLSSPTGVLQRTLVSLSDSSCNSSPSFAAVAAAGSGDGRPEATGLPWTSANAKKW